MNYSINFLPPATPINPTWAVKFDKSINTLKNWDRIQAELVHTACLVEDHFDTWVAYHKDKDIIEDFNWEHAFMARFLCRMETERNEMLERLNEAYDNVTSEECIANVEAQVVEEINMHLDALNEALNLMA